MTEHHNNNRILDLEEVNRTRTALLSAAICVFAVIAQVVFGLKASSDGHDLHAWVLLVNAVITSSVLWYYFVTKHLMVLISYFMIGYSALCLYLLATGGENNSGMLWLFAYPPLAICVVGLRLGLLALFLMTVLNSIILFVPHLPFVTNSYGFDVKLRFSGSMLLISVISGLMEYARLQALQHVKQMGDRLAVMARTDTLTGLPNRRDLENILAYELERAERQHQPCSLILLDIDHFKRVNDIYGHAVGDMALRHLAQEFRTHLRAIDHAGRWGGEEFLIILPTTPPSEAFVIAERLRTAIEKSAFESQGHRVNFTVSCGISSTDQSFNRDELLKRADVHLYSAKSAGRNCSRPIYDVQPELPGLTSA